MNNYKGLFTFDVDNHRYLPIEQADGLISDMFYNPEPKEEPKEFFAISPYKKEGYEVFPYDNFGHIYKLAEELGIAFETREEAEKAVEKLKAWKRLKDKGFKFDGYGHYHWTGEEWPHIDFSYPKFDDLFDDKQAVADLDLLFGGEDD